MTFLTGIAPSEGSDTSAQCSQEQIWPWVCDVDTLCDDCLANTKETAAVESCEAFLPFNQFSLPENNVLRG